MQVKPFPITLKSSTMLSSRVKHFVFQSSLAPTFDYLPGHFITIHFEHEGKILRRSYSIANSPSMNNCIEFAAGYVENGPGTDLLFNLKPGDTIHITGPFGRLILKDEIPKRYILVATSTGITPYRAMIPELKRRLDAHPELNVVILQGVQRQNDALYIDELLTFAQNPRVLFQAYLSRETGNHLQTHEQGGYVQTAFPKLNLNPAEDVVYLCGNPGMIDDAFEYLKNLGFTMQHIIREKYISGK